MATRIIGVVTTDAKLSNNNVTVCISNNEDEQASIWDYKLVDGLFISCTIDLMALLYGIVGFSCIRLAWTVLTLEYIDLCSEWNFELKLRDRAMHYASRKGSAECVCSVYSSFQIGDQS